MLLSGEEIQKNLGGNIIIEPYHPSQLNPNSYNLRLSNELLVYDTDTLDMKANNPVRHLTIPDSGLLLETNKLYLGRTLEYTKTEQFVPRLEGRSSVGRLGLPHCDLSQCRDLPDLLPHHTGRVSKVRLWEIPEQHRRSAQHAV